MKELLKSLLKINSGEIIVIVGLAFVAYIFLTALNAL